MESSGICAVAGIRRPTRSQWEFVEKTTESLLDVRTLVSGCQVGVDSICAYVAEKKGWKILLTVPQVREQYEIRALLINGGLYERATENVARLGTASHWEVEGATPGRNVSEGYRNRNALTISKVMVPGAFLLAFPGTRKMIQRSGTWNAIRQARKAGVEIRIFPLDGTEPWTEPREQAGLF